MDEKKFKCPDCGKEFPSKDIMLQHKKDAHPVKEEKHKKPVTKGKMLAYAIIAVIILAVAGVAYWIFTNSASNPGSINSYNYSYVPFEGNGSAKLSIIEFGDYQCPICGAFFTQTEPQVTTDYVDSGKARFYFMDFAFLGPDSQTLAQGAWCANEQNLYYPYHDFIYSHQGTENSGWATPDKVEKFAAQITRMNAQQFTTCLESQKYNTGVRQEAEVAASSGVQGTPTFFIGNPGIGYVTLVGNQPYSVFQQTINSQLSKVS